MLIGQRVIPQPPAAHGKQQVDIVIARPKNQNALEMLHRCVAISGFQPGVGQVETSLNVARPVTLEIPVFGDRDIPTPGRLMREAQHLMSPERRGRDRPHCP